MQQFQKLNQSLLIKPKLLYFTIALCFYMFHQFRGQFIFERYGVEKGKIGLYLSVPQAFSFFSNIWIGGVNDRSGQQKLILAGLLIIGGIFFEAFFWTTSSPVFWALYVVYFSFMSATTPLLDKVMMDYVSDIPGMGSKSLGGQRMWLTFGYLATNFTVEDIIATSDPKVNNYDKMRPFNILVTAVAITFVLFFVGNLPRRHSNTNYLSSVGSLVKNFEYMYFIFIIILSGISRAFMTTYLGLYYSKVLQFNDQKNNLGLPGFLNTIVDWAYAHKQSTSTVFSVLFEIVGFYFSSNITDMMGLFLPIFLAQILNTVRFVCYYYLSYENQNSFAYCCLFELVKGAGFAFTHISALQLANCFCPPNLRTTSQLIYSGSFVAVGTVLSGVIFQSFFSPDSKDVDQVYDEFRNAFKWNIIISLVGLAVFIVKYVFYENLLFSKENAKKKIEEFERRAIEDEERLENNGNTREAVAAK